MTADPRWDPEMLALLERRAAAAARHPPLPADAPVEAERAQNEKLGLPDAAGGPVMAETTERWVMARGRRIFCRIHKPVLDGPLPTLLYFHAGGWVLSSVDTHDRVAREYAAAGGVAAVNVDYSLSPEAKFPQALEECAAIARHLAVAGEAWGLDGSRLILAGDSAGGNLALATGLLLRDTAGPRPRGILAAYPICDSDFTTDSYREFGTGYPLTAEKMRFFWQAYVRHEFDRLHPLAAVRRAHLGGLPPVLLQAAELDVLRSEAEGLALRLKQARVDTEFEIFPGLTHGFMRATEGVARAREAAAKAGRWLRRIVEG